MSIYLKVEDQKKRRGIIIKGVAGNEKNISLRMNKTNSKMKARVFRVFKDKDHTISYIYVDVAKCHDDVESVDHRTVCVPMMGIRIFKDDHTLEEEIINTYATPEVLKQYTDFDMFDKDYTYSIEGRVYDIEFEWVEKEYPYIKCYDQRDYIIADTIKFPNIKSITEVFIFNEID